MDMAVDPSYRVLVLSSLAPRAVARLVSRLEQELPGVKVCGVLYERRPGKPFGRRCREFVRQLRDPAFVGYAAAKVAGSVRGWLARLGGVALRLLHGDPGGLRGRPAFGLDGLARFCTANGCALHVTADLHAAEALKFARGLGPDLGVVYGTRILKEQLFGIPREGSINVHKRKVPDYRGGGPIGLWELLDDQPEIGVTVHRVTAALDAGAVLHATTVPVEPFDTLTSLALKADVVGDDLLVRTIGDFARGEVRETVQEGPSRMFKTPSPQELRRLQQQLAARRPAYRPERGWPAWKLLLRTVVLGPCAVGRNWWRWLRGSFPVVVLYHHLVADRPHRMGIPTELFLRHVEFLQAHYQVVGLDDAVRLLEAGKVRRPTVVLTFDDGYRDNFLNLRAVTEATGVPVTLFVCTEKVNAEGEFEHDRKWGYRDFRAMSWEQVAVLDRAGMLIGSHTRTHFNCGSREPAPLQAEIGGSRTQLEERLRHPVEFFSFPWGLPANMSPEAVDVARKSYPYICSAHGGVNAPRRDGAGWHVLRCPHPNDLWELELTLQSLVTIG
jgi:peptidoglycan/xylan/chitin deacetylase (PgdA/CDA1 family)